MNRSSRLLLAAAMALGVTLSALPAAHAGPAPRALDYQANVTGCPSAERFADEVSAKLGFVPWDAHPPGAIRVRIAQDGGEVVGTIEQGNGASKVLRAATCAKLDEALVAAIAVALDEVLLGALAGVPDQPQTFANITGEGDHRLSTLEKERDPGVVTVEMHAKDGRALEISRVLSNGMIYNLQGNVERNAAVTSYAKVCYLPCTARLAQGLHTLIVRDVANDYSATKEVEVRVNSTLELDYVSRAATRNTTRTRKKWGFLIGFVAGTIATAYFVETKRGDRSGAMHLIDPTIGLVTGLAGWIIEDIASPGLPADEMRITVRPGLRHASR